MSPLVLRSGVKNPPSDGAQQHWSMLVFESLSAGAMALFVAIAAVMVLVGAYLILRLASDVLGPLEFRPRKIRALVR